jgi:hypothetical protein
LFEAPLLVPCAYAGGVFRSRILLGRFRAALQHEPGLVATAPVHDPAIGALLEAYRAVGEIPYGILSRFWSGD